MPRIKKFLPITILTAALGISGFFLPASHDAEAATAAKWSVSYYNNTGMSGTPVLKEEISQNELGLKVDNGKNSPATGVNSDNFSAVYQSDQVMPAGNYILRTRADDGIRVYVDGKKVIDDWTASSYWKSEKSKVITVSDLTNQSNKQLHRIKVEYYDKTGGSGLEVYLHPYEDETEDSSWLGLYYSNKSYSGTPALVEGGATAGTKLTQLLKDWGRESPADGLPADNFTATYLKKLAGGKDYFVQSYADDQIEVKIGNQTVIKQNYNSSGAINTGVAVNVGSGEQTMKVNYLEATGRARFAAEAVEFGDWIGWYYDNTSLSGTPKRQNVIQGDGKSLKVENGSGSPISGIGKDNFSVRYSTAQRIKAGKYILRTRADDGMRVYIDGKLAVDGWKSSSYWKSEQVHMIDIKDKSTSGSSKDVHEITIEYYEKTGGSGLEFYLNSIQEEAAANKWLGLYYNNTSLSGLAAVIEGGATAGTKQSQLFHNWDKNKPYPNVNEDNFTASYYKLLDGSKDYFIQTFADDRIRAKANGKTIINRWTNSSGIVDSGIITDLAAGNNLLQVDYMEAGGRARIAGDAVPLGNWIAWYYNNTSLSGFPAAQNTISSDGTSLKVENGYGSPVSAVGGDYFSASYATAQRIKAGDYIVRTRADDGMRVYIDGKLAVDSWESSSYWKSEQTHVISVKDHTTGNADQKDIHTIRIEYYEQTKGSGLEFYLQPASAELEKDSWLELYYNNTNQSGTPVKAVGGATAGTKVKELLHNWGTGKPYAEVNADNFSAKFMKLIAGGKDYVLETYADDGVKATVDDKSIINRWSNSSGKSDFGTITGLSAGDHRLTVDYFENTNNAGIAATVAPFGNWIASYYNNTSLTGMPKTVKTVSGNGTSLKVENGNGSPTAGINADNFSVSYKTAQRINSGSYILRTRADDGIRVYLDGNLVVDKWSPSSYWKSESTDIIQVKDRTTGSAADKNVHTIEIQYYDNTGSSGLEFYLQNADKEVEKNSWFGQFYPNSTLSGNYVNIVGGATSGNKLDTIRYNWGTSQSISGLPADNFSARFRKVITGGKDYFAQAFADDGIRMSLDGSKFIDKWTNSSGDIYRATLPAVASGDHTVTAEYYENTGKAAVFADVVPFGNWMAYYYDNTETSGAPVNAKIMEPNSNNGFTEDFGYDAPMANVPANNYSTRYVTAKRLTAGDYYINTIADDGVQVLIDGKIVIDRYTAGNSKNNAVKYSVKNGAEGDIHWIEVRYLEKTGKSNIDFSITPFKESSLINKDTWTIQYYPNVINPSNPVSSTGLVEIDQESDVNFNWGSGSPASSIPNDNFSAVMSKQVYFSKSSNYDFSVNADDGVKLLVDGKTVIDSWVAKKGLREEKAKYMDKGYHTVTIQYFESTGNASINLDIKESVKQEVIKTYSDFSLTLDQMTTIQGNSAPKTDKRYDLYLREDAFYTKSNGKLAVEGGWNIRTGPGTNYGSHDLRFLAGDSDFTILSTVKGTDGKNWMKLGGWVPPSLVDLKYYINPANFQNTLKAQLQFVKLSEPGTINVNEVNEKVLTGKGILAGKASSYQKAAEQYGVNAVYLMAHSFLETGNGTSQLAKGVTYNGKTVYNMYGIGATDNNALSGGSAFAYSAGWFTPEAAIIGGAEFVRKDYIDRGQDTIYEMRWNPVGAAANGYATHQYATDIGWASKQTSSMYNIYNILESYSITLDIPRYK